MSAPEELPCSHEAKEPTCSHEPFADLSAVQSQPQPQPQRQLQTIPQPQPPQQQFSVLFCPPGQPVPRRCVDEEMGNLLLIVSKVVWERNNCRYSYFRVWQAGRTKYTQEANGTLLQVCGAVLRHNHGDNLMVSYGLYKPLIATAEDAVNLWQYCQNHTEGKKVTFDYDGVTKVVKCNSTEAALLLAISVFCYDFAKRTNPAAPLPGAMVLALNNSKPAPFSTPLSTCRVHSFLCHYSSLGDSLAIVNDGAAYISPGSHFSNACDCRIQCLGCLDTLFFGGVVLPVGPALCITNYCVRRNMIKKLNIEDEGACGSFWRSFFCPLCALSQQKEELEVRGIAPRGTDGMCSD